MDKVVSAGGEGERNGESEVGRGDGVEVDWEHVGGVGNDGFAVDCIHKGF